MKSKSRLERLETATRARAMQTARKIRLELRRSCVVKRGTFIVSSDYEISLFRPAYFSDKMLTESAKKKPGRVRSGSFFTHTK